MVTFESDRKDFLMKQHHAVELGLKNWKEKTFSQAGSLHQSFTVSTRMPSGTIPFCIFCKMIEA